MRGAFVVLLLCACKAQVGGPCFRDDECAADIPQGYCAKAEICTRACGPKDERPPLSGLDNIGCPAGSRCTEVGPHWICLHSCKTDRDCNKDFGFVCREGVCVYPDPLQPPPR